LKIDFHILAIDEVDGKHTNIVYLKKPFKIQPDFAVTSVTYNIGELVKNAELILERGKI
jgi:hypothetical protein